MGIEHEVKEQRELIASLMLENAALRNTSAKQETEIERLHKELQETKNWLRVRTETKWHAEDEVERLRMEVEKLRGLLRYWLEGGTDNIDTLEDRVREALGEEEPR